MIFPIATAPGTRRLLRVPEAARLTRGAALAGLVAALVLGILGMHALANHGTPASVATAQPAAAATSGASMTSMSSHDEAMASGGGHDRHTHVGATHSPAAATAADVAVGMSPGSGHDMSGMVMLCVVMLAAVALTLLALLVAGTVRRLLPTAFRPAAACERIIQWVRGTGPPPVWEFSVIRC